MWRLSAKARSPTATESHQLVQVHQHERDVAVPLGDAHENEVVILHVHESHALHREDRLLLHLLPLLDVIAAMSGESKQIFSG